MPIKRISLCISLLTGILLSSQTKASWCCWGISSEEDIYNIELDERINHPLHIGTRVVQVPRALYHPNETIYKTLKISNLTPPEVSVRGEQDFSYTDASFPQPSMQAKHVGAIIGRDDRIRVMNTSTYPNSAHGYLEMTYPNGERGTGTGTMIQSHHVLTAAHNLYDANCGGWATCVKFTAAINEKYPPFPPAYATRLITVKGYVEGNKEDYARGNKGDKEYEKYDYALITLDRDLGHQTGWLGIIEANGQFLKRLSVNVTGYPGDKKRAAGGLPQMWTMSGNIETTLDKQYTYTLDTSAGQSGSGVWSALTIEPGKLGYYCSGVHVIGVKNKFNIATCISEDKFNNLIKWMSEW